LRIRRGDPDADTPLSAARELAAAFCELQRSVYVAVLVAEHTWLRADDAPVSIAPAVAQLEAVFSLAMERNARWVAEDAALWLRMLGRPPVPMAGLTGPYREQCEGRWQSAARGWAAWDRPYEQALALSQGDEAAQRQALDLFDAMGASPAAARVRRDMRARGARSIPRGPIATTRASPGGLTRRQAQVLGLVDDGLSNLEIADRLCISVKTAEHHVSAVMLRLDVGTRREAAATARSLGILNRGHQKTRGRDAKDR
jgi:DNA-binding CsgD family transcriptional regulator